MGRFGKTLWIKYSALSMVRSRARMGEGGVHGIMLCYGAGGNHGLSLDRPSKGSPFERGLFSEGVSIASRPPARSNERVR